MLDNLALVLLLTKGRTLSFHVLAVIRRIYGIAYRANCDLVFRWVPSEVNYSDRGSRFYDADYDPLKCLLNRLRVLQRQSMSSLAHHQAPFSSLVTTSPCHHMAVRLVNPTDQGITVETPVSRVPQTTVPVIGHQCDTTEKPLLVWIPDSVSAADCISVFQACFSGERVLELWPTLFGSVDVSEASGCCASSDGSVTPSQPSQASLDKRSSSCRNHSSEVPTAVFSRLCPEASSTSDPVELAEPDSSPTKPFGNLGRRDCDNYPRRWRRGGIRNGDRTLGQSSARGTTSRRRVDDELGFARLLGM